MSTLAETAPAFVTMAHEIVWCSVSTVDRRGRPRSRVLHPIWETDGDSIHGWIITAPTPQKLAHLEQSPHVSCTYWAPSQDTCTADCDAVWYTDDETRIRVWDHFKNFPPPVGYDPAMIPEWTSPTDDNFAALRLDPWRLRVFPGSLLMGGEGEMHTWRRDGS